jgi:hypothetical protein
METVVEYSISFTPGGGAGHLAFRTEGRPSYDRMNLSPADVAAVSAMFAHGSVGYIRASERFVMSSATLQPSALNEREG